MQRSVICHIAVQCYQRQKDEFDCLRLHSKPCSVRGTVLPEVDGRVRLLSIACSVWGAVLPKADGSVRLLTIALKDILCAGLPTLTSICHR